jgi:uncharacterized protein (DUF924 family)
MPEVHDFKLVLDFWFGDAASDLEILEQKSSLWWEKDTSLDAKIALRFSATLNSLVAGELSDWKNTPESYLTMIILADQFSRNIYRDTKKAFAQDELALALTLEGLETRLDLKLGKVHRIFFYMPLEHAENLSIQDRSIEMYRELYESAPENLKARLKGNLDYAILHREVIEKFGRYPHRNEILNRQSTVEEREYLKQPGSGF